MLSTNGHGPQRAILYTRVSTEEQARSGYSLAQQMEALREYAAHEGYEVLEEVADSGQSGASLERPGMDRVRDLVQGGGVSVVLSQDRDRFAREPAYHYLLRREFEEYGCALRALNDRGDNSPEGELTDGIMDQLAKFERAKTAERTRRGKLRKAREGKVIASTKPDYGFSYNVSRDSYVVDEETMRIVRRIFHMVGIEGKTTHAVKVAFEREGIQSPGGGAYWNKTFIRRCILDDVYRPHTFKEIKALVSPDVCGRLDPRQLYGVWFFNRRRIRHTQVSENGADGRTYRRRSATVLRPKEEWIAVPVPDAGIPREVVDAAREAVLKNRSASSAGRRFWELSGGILCCGGCGRRMVTHAVTNGKYKSRYFYYICSKIMDHGKDACPQNKGIRADVLEPRLWTFVCNLLTNPVRLRAGLNKMIEAKRKEMRGDPKREIQTWLEKLAEAERMRSGYQELTAKGLMTFEELNTKLAELEETREMAEKELAGISQRQEEVEELEQDRDALLRSYSDMVREDLNNITPEEHHRIYKMLRLNVVPRTDGTFEVSGALTDRLDVLVSETASG